MANRSKQKGTAFETAVVRFLQANGFPKAHRKVLTGRLDTGDIAIDDNNVYVAECKNTQRLTFSEFVDEAVTEAKNADAVYGVAIVKRRNRGVEEAYAVMRLRDWTEMAAS